jgi:hypothetical protein
MSFSDIFSFPKDILLSTVIRPFVQSSLDPYGTITELQLDSKAKSISLFLDLKGEDRPVEIHLNDYEIVEQGGETLIRFGEMVTSREWLTQLIRDYVPAESKSLPLPGNIAAAARMLL